MNAPHDSRDRSVADVEAETRADLAAAFRWAARLNFHEATANHFSAAVSDDVTLANSMANPVTRLKRPNAEPRRSLVA